MSLLDGHIIITVTINNIINYISLYINIALRLPSLLNKSYSGKTYSFRATQTPRAVKR